VIGTAAGGTINITRAWLKEHLVGDPDAANLEFGRRFSLLNGSSPAAVATSRLWRTFAGRRGSFAVGPALGSSASGTRSSGLPASPPRARSDSRNSPSA
jgi:hypothetical protein